MSSLRDTILGSDDIEAETLEIPEWGNVKIELRSPSLRDRLAMFDQATNDDGLVNRDLMFPLLVVSAAHDPETGEAIFTAADVEALTEKSAPVIERVATVAMRLAGMLPDAVDVGKVDSSTIPNAAARST